MKHGIPGTERRVMLGLRTAIIALSLLVMPQLALAQQGPKTETDCTNGVDDDGDGLPDCGDADCVNTDACKPDGQPENTNVKCSDWKDNDGDGYIDCEDDDCNAPNVKACKGSWTGTNNKSGGDSTPAPKAGAPDDFPELSDGQSVEDLIGKGGDKDGERNDYLCSDGVDNDGDGRTDCADFGCRFDPTVTVCRGNPGMRFSIVANVGYEHQFPQSFPDQPTPRRKAVNDVRFTRLQLRSFGPMPLMQDSFYLISMRAEKTPRLTFAMFQIPIAKGHFMNINSGAGGLNNAGVLSTAKNLLLEPPFYLFNAFDQGYGATVTFDGPLDPGKIAMYRAYVAGGAGIFNGNVGGRFFDNDNTNFTYGAGLSLQFNIVGGWSRWDTQFLYTSVPLATALTVGAKYDQRSQERYVAANMHYILRWNILELAAEAFMKREFEFESWQMSYNIRLGILLWQKHLMFGADWGEFIPLDPENPIVNPGLEIRRQRTERQGRVALHWYFFRNIGIASVLFQYREVEPTRSGQIDPDEDHALKVEIQYRF